MKKLTVLILALLFAVLCCPFCLAAGEAPTVSFSNTPTNEPVEVSINAVLSDGDVIMFSIDGTNYESYSEPILVGINCTFTAKVVYADATESAVASVNIECIDTDKPAAPTINIPSEGWSKEAVNVTLVTPSDVGSGVKKMQYSFDKSSWKDYSGSFSVDDNKTVYARAEDKAGNISDVSSKEIKSFDKTAPTQPEIKLSTTDWTNKPVKVELVGGSDEQSGLKCIEYSFDEKNWSTYVGPFEVSSNTRLCVRARDNADNVSKSVVTNIDNIDTTAPSVVSATVSLSGKGTGTTGIPPYYFCGTVSATIGSVTDDKSGVDYIEYQFLKSGDSLSDTAWKKYSNKITLDNECYGKICFRAVDKAGNTSSVNSSDGIIIDLTAPEIGTPKLSPKTLTESFVTVTFTAKDTYLDTITVNGDSIGTYSPSFKAFKNGEYEIVVTDKAGNSTKLTVEIENIDSSPFTLLESVEKLKEEDYTSESWEALMKVVKEMEELLESEKSDKKVRECEERLVKALEALVEKGDNDALEELLKSIDKLDPTVYTSSSWAVLESYLPSARELIESDDASQNDVDTARRNIEAAKEALVKIGDFTGLDRLISQCDNLVPEEYDAELFAAFTQVLEEARALDRADASQEQIDDLYFRLLAAMKSLAIIEEESNWGGPVAIVCAVLFVILIVSVLFISSLKKKHSPINIPFILGTENADDDDDEDYDDDGEDKYLPRVRAQKQQERVASIKHESSDSGDIHFED